MPAEILLNKVEEVAPLVSFFFQENIVQGFSLQYLRIFFPLWSLNKVRDFVVILVVAVATCIDSLQITFL